MKYCEYAIVFAEFPDEICLALSISNCPCCCDKCSEPWLQADVGTPVTVEEITKLVKKHPGVTMIGFMGGDRYHSEIVELARAIHDQGLKVGMYSGLDSLDLSLLNSLDYYKIGRWIMPIGDPESWWKSNCGPLKFTFSNQLMFKRIGSSWVNITNRFRDKPLNNLKKEII